MAIGATPAQGASTRVAIDVGGTFTDVVTLESGSGRLRFDKVPTTPAAPTQGVLDGFAKAEAEPRDTFRFNHGTTLGLNALLTRTGARVAVVATRGFRDVYLLGRTDRSVSYDLRYRKPPALVDRADTFEVTERCWFDGTIGTPLDEAEARRVAELIKAGGYQSVAVTFLHSYANPAHEARMGEILTDVAPELDVTVSHELSREYREYERTSTTVLDAYIKPTVRGYLADLRRKLAEQGFAGQFLITRSGGGAMTATAATRQPVNLILSGPAGGVVGAAEFSRLIDRPNLITIDMGGTSLDASLVLDHEPLLHRGAEFEGLPINTTSLNIQTIGAGGGSIAWLDAAGALQVGPQSAGAVPGPASYGRGGTEPTVTDAALVVGYLGSDTPLGGELELDEPLARAALAPLARSLGLSEDALARGILQISTIKITGAVRGITVELGLDPKDFGLLSYGGGGGLLATNVARELGIPTVIIPPGQGAFSALGMLMADVQHDFAQTAITPLASIDPAEVAATFAELEAEANDTLEEDGFGPAERRLTRSVDVRYVGQEHTVTVEHSAGDGDFRSAVEDRFTELHQRQFGHTMTDPIEITTYRLRAVGVVDKPRLPKLPDTPPEPPPMRPEPVEGPNGDALRQAPGAVRRPVQVTDDEPAVDYALHARESLTAGERIDGPAVITEHTATTVIHAGDTLRVGTYGELVIEVSREVP